MDKLLKKIKTRLIPSRRRHTNPNKDWLVLLTLFFVVNIILIGYLILKHHNITGSVPDLPKPDPEIRLIDPEAIDSVLSVYEQKQKKIFELTENPSEIPDPSI